MDIVLVLGQKTDLYRKFNPTDPIFYPSAQDIFHSTNVFKESVKVWLENLKNRKTDMKKYLPIFVFGPWYLNIAIFGFTGSKSPVSRVSF